MNRLHPNEHELFSASTSACFQELEDSIKARRESMRQNWADIDQGWQDLGKRMREVGLLMVSTGNSGTVELNIGGSEFNIPRSVFDEMQDIPATWTLGYLFGGADWDERLPRSKSGRIFLDESPACVKHLIREFVKKSGPAAALQALGVNDLPPDELPYLSHVKGALGFSLQTLPANGTAMRGGSTVLEVDEISPLAATLLSWCPGESESLELLYRASRDGWTAAAFHAKCDSSSSTITLVRTKAQGSDTTDSVVGGFSSFSWGGKGSYESPGAFFLCKLKDGGRWHCFEPTKWSLCRHPSYAVRPRPNTGPTFGEYSDLSMHLDDVSVPRWRRTLLSNRSNNGISVSYGDRTRRSPLVELHGRPMVEFEVFRVCSETLTPTPAAMSLPTPPERKHGEGLVKCSAVFKNAAPMSTEEHRDDARCLGISIAESLKAERTALYHAQTELLLKNAKAAASREAFLAVYGPDVAASQDAVVELTFPEVRPPAKIATLLSTLRVCSDSALAAKFSSNWAESKDWDVIRDCSPVVFSKILDVLRMRKRMASVSSVNGQGETPMVRVVVNATDRDSFKQYVDMYFVGCERFITNFIEFR